MLRKILISLYNNYNVNLYNQNRNYNKIPFKSLIYQTTIQSAKMSTGYSIVNYDDVLSATKNNSVYIIDVREPSELQESGKIPNSINIPLNEVENVLKNYSDDKFESNFGREKPNENTPIIFSCRSGKRASTALETALKLGFNNLKLYQGSWLDWEKHNN